MPSRRKDSTPSERPPGPETPDEVRRRVFADTLCPRCGDVDPSGRVCRYASGPTRYDTVAKQIVGDVLAECLTDSEMLTDETMLGLHQRGIRALVNAILRHKETGRDCSEHATVNALRASGKLQEWVRAWFRRSDRLYARCDVRPLQRTPRGEIVRASGASSPAEDRKARPAAFVEPRKRRRKSVWLAEALVLLAESPELTVQAIAAQVGVDRTTLHRCEAFKTIRRQAKAGKRSRVPRGTKHQGQTDATAPGEEE